MRELWKAFIARLIYVLTPKPPAVPQATVVEVPMKPGTCECSHDRCHHIGGKGHCAVGYEPNSEENNTGKWQYCACQIFIRDDDDDEDDEPETPTPSELERMYSK